MKLESERLIIRAIEINDAPFYFMLFNDPDWIRFISNKKLKSVEETKVFLEEMLTDTYTKSGLGYFTVILKETNEAIGVSTALKREALAFIDVGYGFLPKGRGKGYAREATLLILQYVQQTFKQKKAFAFTIPQNDKSQILLKKLNFSYIGLQAVLGDENDAVFEYVF
jgi:RimJ/RimL family protein N-acetyltransferase